MIVTARRVVGLVVMAVVGSACTLASPTYITAQEGKQTAAGDGGTPSTTGSASGDATPATCKTDDFIKPDLSKLKACGEGKGHCLDKTKIAAAGILTACEDASEVCVPDNMLEANGEPLKGCTSILGGKPGACVTYKLVPMIEEMGGSALEQDVCAADQKCVPCTDPRNGNPSGFCEPNGVHENACSAGTAPSATAGDGATNLPGCCVTNGKSNGVCFPEDQLPPAQKDQTIDDTCTGGNKCVPASLVNLNPTKCNGGMLMGKGVCIDKCFNKLMSLAGSVGALKQDVCGETEVCIPCRFIKDTGAPGCE